MEAYEQRSSTVWPTFQTNALKCNKNTYLIFIIDLVFFFFFICCVQISYVNPSVKIQSIAIVVAQSQRIILLNTKLKEISVAHVRYGLLGLVHG